MIRFLLLLFMRINKCENTPQNTFQIVKFDFYWNFMSIDPAIYRSVFASYGVFGGNPTDKHVCFLRNEMATTLKWDGNRKRNGTAGTMAAPMDALDFSVLRRVRNQKLHALNHLTFTEPMNSLLLWPRRRKPPLLPQTMCSLLICKCAPAPNCLSHVEPPQCSV